MNRVIRTASTTVALVVFTATAPVSAGLVKQITDSKDVSYDWPMPNGDGSEIFVATSSNDAGGNPNHLFRIVAFNTTTGVGTPITSFPASLVHLRHNVTVTEDGQWLAFISNGDLVPGQNPARADQAFSIKRDGTQLTQLTHISGPSGGGVIRIAMAGTADRVMVATSADLTGGNPQRAHQVFVMQRDGSNLIQVTNAPSGTIDHLWISDDGTRIAFNHTGDLTGGNADHNNEVFAITVGDAAPRQITSSTAGASDSANFNSSSGFFENDPDHAFSALYRYDLTTDTIQRSGGLRFENTNFDWQPSVNTDGSKVLYSTFSDSTGANPDEYWELDFVDFNAPNPPVISGGPAPTIVTFHPEPGMVRYDIIRGSVANLHNAGSTVDMGAVTCLKDDSGDTSTAGYPDFITPSPGQALFYLFRGTQGVSAGPGSYGTGTAGERVAGSGDCNP